jgi:LacI family transcriptional regulator
MVTLKDISKDTGVSVTQVSRALGGFEDVNVDTRKRIKAAALRLGYHPNSVARSLKSGRSGIVAMIVPLTPDLSAQEVMFELLMGISAEMSKQNLKFVLHVAQLDDDMVALHEQLFNGGGIDGFILLSPFQNDERILHLMANNIPHVVHGTAPGLDHPFVDVDNIAIGRVMADHVLAKKHTQIAFFNGPELRPFAQQRLHGLFSTLKAAGISPLDTYVSHGEMTVERGEIEALELLRGPNPPSAFIASNTKLAQGIYRAAQMCGLAIPGDISVLAHDDGLLHHDVERFDPPLSGTGAHFAQAWQEMSNLLKNTILNGPREVPGRILPAPFVARGSTAEK